MSSGPGFRLHRARWRLRGNWTWPVFGLVTVIDAVVLHVLPPVSGGVDFVPALIVGSFGNLFLVGAIAPWLGGRLAAREQLAGGSVPREVFTDRAAVGLLLAGVAALVAAGLGTRPVIVSETRRTERIVPAIERYVAEHATPEVQRNLQTANTKPLDDRGNFRVCISLDDRTRAWCMFVDASRDPATVTPDSDRRPNALYFGEQ
jgi:hypothetical protein